MVPLRTLAISALAAPLVWAGQPNANLQTVREEAYRLAQDRKYQEAALKYRELRELSLARRDPALATQALSSIAGCSFALFQYRDAMRLYESALAEALAQGNRELQTMIAANMASLSASLGENRKALDAMLRFPIDGSAIREESRLDWLSLLVQVSARERRRDVFLQAKSFAQAEASRPVPGKLAAAAPERLRRWPEAQSELRRASLNDVLSDAFHDLNELATAAAHAREAYRLRATYRDPVRLRSLVQLAILERKSGHLDAAWRLSEIALNGKDFAPTPIQLFRLHRERGLILMSRNRPAEALLELRMALSYPRAWRAEVLPADSAILSFENFLNGQIHREFLDAVATLPQASLTASVAEESFAVAEEARFASLRAAFLPQDQLGRKLGDGYWPLLRNFQDAQSRVLAGDESFRPERDRLEQELTRMETRAGLQIPHFGDNHSAPARKLPVLPGETIFAFHLSEPVSLGWALSQGHIEVRRLPGRRQIHDLAASFAGAIASDRRPGDRSTGSRLTKNLFGEFSSPQRTNPLWTVVIEDSLASIPMSALPTIDGKNRFLLEEHTIRLVPSASFVASENPLPWSRTATAFADPIYNAADDRVRSGQPLRTGFQLNRLPASLTEAHSSMRTLSTLGWQTRIHSGSDSHPGNLRSAVLASRDVLHLAAHFSADPERPELLSVALSATDTGGVALFSAKDLTVLRTRTKLVALDGCTSAAGQTYAGLGIVGLSRAWIISGAQNVIGTIWPIEDSAGPFFPEFYARAAAHPYSSRAIAAALRQTQLQMMRRLDRYASPRYWAAYTLLQRS